MLSVLPALGPAQAITSAYLCSGYSGCASAGYSNSGYAGNNHRMYWRMYSGHNCTNYVAYRMVKAGMPNVRPWSGSGNATNWGYAMSKITDQTPRVGAVAWWRAGDNVGSAGHVAYVEKVVSKDEIIVSEDSWGGTFHWRRITRSGPWPTGFIHFIDKTIENTRKPAVRGTPKVGEPLTADPGAWRPDARSVYQWYVGGERVRGAHAATFVPEGTHAGKPVSVRITARKRSYTPTRVFSAATAPVAEGALASTEPPVVNGTPFVDRTLTARAGGFEPAAENTIVRWQANRRNIHTGETLTLTEDLLGKQVRVITIAQREGYRRSVARSQPVGPVAAGKVQITEPFRTRGRSLIGKEVWVEPGAFTPVDAAVGYQWLRNGKPVPGATKPRYQVTPEDAGAQLAVRVRVSKSDYQPAVGELRQGGPVTTRSQMQLRTRGRSRAAVVVARVTATGLPAEGPVTVRIGRHRETVDLVDGRARVRLTGLAPKQHRVFVHYAGTDVILAKRKAARVRVRR